MASTITEEPKPVPEPPVPVPLPGPCPPGVENCIFDEIPEIVRPQPVRMLADWELALNEWDAQPNGIVAAARQPPPPKKDEEPGEKE